MDFMSLSDACKMLPGEPSLDAVRRWAREGRRIRGMIVRLRAVPGKRGKFFTTAAWVSEFVEALSGQTVTAAPELPPVVPLLPPQVNTARRQAQIDAAMAALARK